MYPQEYPTKCGFRNFHKTQNRAKDTWEGGFAKQLRFLFAIGFLDGQKSCMHEGFRSKDILKADNYEIRLIPNVPKTVNPKPQTPRTGIPLPAAEREVNDPVRNIQKVFYESWLAL